MGTITVRVNRITKANLKRVLRNVPSYCVGRVVDYHGIGRMFRLNMAIAFLEKVSTAFDVKSRGGTDDLGNRWKPLKKETIAQRPLHPGDKKRLGITKGMKFRGLLTAEQDKLWRGIFRSNFLKLASRIGKAAAAVQAAKLAWAIVKAHGGKTKLEVLGNRNVLINRITDALFDSLSPGSRGRAGTSDRVSTYTPPEGQLFQVDRPGEIVLGSKIKYAERVAKLRALIPRRHRPWTNYATNRGVEAAVGAIVKVVT